MRADQLAANIPITAHADTAPVRRRPTIKTFLIGLAFFGAIAVSFVAGVLITIKRNGEIYQIEAPPSSRTTIDANGNPTLDLSNKPEAGKALAASYADDLKALEGEWKVVRLEKGRDKLSAAGINLGTHLRFRSWSLKIRNIEEGNEIHWGFRIDPAASPKTIDFLNGEFRETDILGVYKIDADRLTICFDYCPPPMKTQRPKSLAVEPGSADVLLVLERYQLTVDEKAIEGDWTAVSQIKDGKPIPDGDMHVEYVKNIQTLSIMHKDWAMIRGGCVLNPAKEPKQITVHTDPIIGGYLLGIYHFEGDQLKIAYRYPIQTLGGDQRPKQFESLPGSGVTLLVLKKKELQQEVNPYPVKTQVGSSQEPLNSKSISDTVNPAAELKALVGPWKVVRVEKGKDANGNWMYVSDFKAVDYLSFDERYLKVQDFTNGVENMFKYSVDPTAEPKTLDLRELESQNPPGELVALGIYKSESDRMSILLTKYLPALKSQQRPKDFAIDANSADVLLCSSAINLLKTNGS